MIPEPEVLEFKEIPSDLDRHLLINSMLGKRFALCHSLEDMKTLLITDGMDVNGKMGRTIPGVVLDRASINLDAVAVKCVSGYWKPTYTAESRKFDEPPAELLADLYRIFGGVRAFVFVLFSPSNLARMEAIRSTVERRISKIGVRLSTGLGGRYGITRQESIQTDLYYDSDERKMLSSMLDTLDKVAISNGTSFEINVVVAGNGYTEQILGYIKSRMFLTYEKNSRVNDLRELYALPSPANAIPIPVENAASMISFSDNIERSFRIKTRNRNDGGSILLGEYMHEGLSRSGDFVRTNPEAFNLGMIVTGLPGTGKTAASMSLIRQLARNAGANCIILSPTEEWNSIGRELNMNIIDVYEGGIRMNFFKCDAKISIDRFYENLAMLLASAAGAGPYTNAMEKSLLSAFQKVYMDKRVADPEDAYEHIEAAVIEQHAKRTNVGVTYTKHGENIAAALQPLRLLLSKPQFAYAEGVDFKELATRGVVFDMSKVSNNMKPFFYSLILNQFYGLADALDERGDNELRMLICVEEAQLAFGGDELSAATRDLKQRIQDFRKKGVGLMLITHNITDISVGIRRLCQTKAYFRQSSDMAKYACADLLFDIDDEKRAPAKLKGLGQGICALNYISRPGGQRVQRGTVFVSMENGMTPVERISSEHEIMAAQKQERDVRRAPLADMEIHLLNVERTPVCGVKIAVSYLGETVFEGVTDDQGRMTVPCTLREKRYGVRILGQKRKDTKRANAIGGQENVIVL